MRLDKFLKVSRLIKRRTVAKDVSEQGRVWLNGREAKPSATVKVGDEIRIQFGQKNRYGSGGTSGRNRQKRECGRHVYLIAGRIPFNTITVLKSDIPP